MTKHGSTYMFEPQKRADNKQWRRKDQKRPFVAKRTIRSKKVLYAKYIFNSSRASCSGTLSPPPGSTVTGYFHKHSVLKKWKHFTKRLFMIMHLRTSLKLLRLFSVWYNVKVVNHLAYALRLFLFFPKL